MRKNSISGRTSTLQVPATTTIISAQQRPGCGAPAPGRTKAQVGTWGTIRRFARCALIRPQTIWCGELLLFEQECQFHVNRLVSPGTFDDRWDVVSRLNRVVEVFEPPS